MSTGWSFDIDNSHLCKNLMNKGFAKVNATVAHWQSGKYYENMYSTIILDHGRSLHEQSIEFPNNQWHMMVNTYMRWIL